jgi:tRNA threonylcarbamoyladenosine biosynthesis protein TsaB
VEQLSGTRWQLVLETSSRTLVGLVKDGSLHEQLDLGVGRGQNRWLLPRIQELLTRAGLHPSQLSSIVVCQGPGSYTGLRVGLTVAKTLAYALNCELVAVPTFEAIAVEFAETPSIIVLGDALNHTCYVQQFKHGLAVKELEIQPLDSIISALKENEVVTGPGLVTFAAELPATQPRIEKTAPSVIALVNAASSLQPLSRTDLFALEPLYLRGSSAEEKAKSTTV